MGELAKAKRYEETLGEVLAMMAAALKGCGSNQAALGSAWVMACKGRVEQRWLIPTCQWFILNATFFPTPAEFISRARDIAERTEIQARLEATRAELIEMDEVRILALNEKYPEMDAGQFRAIFQQTAEKVLGPRKTKALPEPKEFVDPEQEARVRKQVEELRG